MMLHALMYVGGFERNFPTLTPSTDAFEGTDGKSHPYAPWPPGVDGLRVGYMEKKGKKFVAVRVADGTSDAVLANDLVMVPGQHFGYGARLGPDEHGERNQVISPNGVVLQSDPIVASAGRFEIQLVGTNNLSCHDFFANCGTVTMGISESINRQHRAAMA